MLLFLLLSCLVVLANSEANYNITQINLDSGFNSTVDMSYGLDNSIICNETVAISVSMFDIVNNPQNATLDYKIANDIKFCRATIDYTVLIQDPNTLLVYFGSDVADSIDIGNIIKSIDLNTAETGFGLCATDKIYYYEFDSGNVSPVFNTSIVCDGFSVGESIEGDHFYVVSDSVSGNVTIFDNSFNVAHTTSITHDSMTASNVNQAMFKSGSDFITLELQSPYHQETYDHTHSVNDWTVGKNDGSLLYQRQNIDLNHLEWLNNDEVYDTNPRFIIQFPGLINKIDAFSMESYIYVFRDEWYKVDADTYTLTPTTSPTKAPTGSPTSSPSASPSASPTKAPTTSPTKSPTTSPTPLPTESPTTGSPTARPTTGAPTTPNPTSSPTVTPEEPEEPESNTTSIILIISGTVVVFGLAVYGNHLWNKKHRENHWNHI